MSELYEIILIIFFMGIFGGIINYLLYSEPDMKLKKYVLLKDMIIGIGSSFLVPLFLYMISSDLLIKPDSLDTNVLVFAGICLLFSISAKPIIENMSNQLLIRLEKKQESTENLLYKMLESRLEPDVNAASNKMSGSDVLNNSDYTKVVNMIGKSNNVYITLQSIEKDSGVCNIESILEALISQEIVSFIVWKDKRYYFLTLKGKSLYVNIND